MTGSERWTLGQRIAPPRFILFVVVFIAVAGLSWGRLGLAHAFIAGFDMAAGLFMLSVLPLVRTQSEDQMRRHAVQNDANRVMLLVIATAVSLVILTSIAIEVSSRNQPNVVLVVTTLALAWLFSNTIYALHYAHLYYAEGSERGLSFSGDPKAPDYSDFIYFSYTLGMTFQTSDTGVETRQLRRIVTMHSLAAFVFNIGVLAFTINVLGSRGG